jgi:hypothetical protein
LIAKFAIYTIASIGEIALGVYVVVRRHTLIGDKSSPETRAVIAVVAGSVMVLVGIAEVGHAIAKL